MKYGYSLTIQLKKKYGNIVHLQVLKKLGYSYALSAMWYTDFQFAVKLDLNLRNYRQDVLGSQDFRRKMPNSKHKQSCADLNHWLRNLKSENPIGHKLPWNQTGRKTTRTKCAESKTRQVKCNKLSYWFKSEILAITRIKGINVDNYQECYWLKCLLHVWTRVTCKQNGILAKRDKLIRLSRKEIYEPC